MTRCDRPDPGRGRPAPALRYQVLAADYDGTLARDGVVTTGTVEALDRLVHSGRRLLVVTGRRLPHLRDAFPRFGLAECVVAENGAVLYWPRTGERDRLGARPPRAFLDRLQAAGVPLAVGECVVATGPEHLGAVRAAIAGSGPDLRVITNKGDVMVLPDGVDKGSGLAAALRALSVPPREVVGVGDAENDYAFLDRCGLAVAVANALPAVRERCDLVTAAGYGAGVTELIDRLLAADDAGGDWWSRPDRAMRRTPANDTESST